VNPSRPFATAALMLLFVAVVNTAFALLVERFGYDDILREPAAAILARFAAGGVSLVVIWFAFALGALLFVPVAILLPRELDRDAGPGLSAVMLFGIASAILQAAGLLRWVFVVPALARAHVDTSASEATREAVLVVFQTVHQYGGVLIGEFLGQCFLIAWTAGTCLAMLRMRGPLRWLGACGLATVPLWLLGFSELIASAVPGWPVLELAPIAFIAWEAWLVAVAVTLIVAGVMRRGRGSLLGSAVAAMQAPR